MKRLILGLIRLYQRFLSPDQGLIKDSGLTRFPRCGFYPTCSEYAAQAVEKYGVLKGLFLAMKRVARCHPWQTKHIDPVP